MTSRKPQELFFIVRKGTSERIVDHGGKPILVKESYIEGEISRYCYILKCHPEDLEALTPDEYHDTFVRPFSQMHHRKPACEEEDLSSGR